MSSPKFIGIDLGTTFSALAHISERGTPEIVPNVEGERTTPSIVLFNGDEILVGKDARDNLTIYPNQGVEFVKRHMGDDLYSFEYGGKAYSAIEISSFILKKLKTDAEKRLGLPIEEAVITVPAYFGDPQRRATIKAGELAGLRVTQVINEPTAAAYSYGLHKLGKDQRVLVFDLGGGTFDVTVIEIRGDTIEVKATDGDHHLGGRDWDEALIQYVGDKFRSQHGISPYENEGDYLALQEKALAAKISLSSLPRTTVNYGCQGKTIKVDITQEDFGKLTENLVERCRWLTELVLREAGFECTDIDVVLLAGGSTRMPMIVTMLRSFFGKDPSPVLNPDECVATGAAVKAALLGKKSWALPGQRKQWSLPPNLSDVNVTSHSFGLAVMKDGELFNSIIIPKNTPYPCQQNRSDYVTSYDNQESLEIYVLEGESEDPYECDLIAAYQVYDLPKAPAGRIKLQVTYAYNQNQIVETTARELKSGRAFPLKAMDNPSLDQISLSQGMDVALLIDCSSSMGGDPLTDAINAAKSFLDNCAGASVALITFPGGIQQGLSFDFTGIRRAITNLTAYDATPMTEALNEATEILLSDGRDRVIVLLTDGAPNDRATAMQSANIAKAQDIRIIAVGVGGADETFLRQIASSRGDFYFCHESFELTTTFVNIATQLTGTGQNIRKR